MVNVAKRWVNDQKKTLWTMTQIECALCDFDDDDDYDDNWRVWL